MYVYIIYGNWYTTYHNESDVEVFVSVTVQEPENYRHELLTGSHTHRLTGLLSFPHSPCCNKG